MIAITLANLDGFGQASAITSGTGGVLLTSSGDVAGAILSGLQDLPADIVPTYTCSSPT